MTQSAAEKIWKKYVGMNVEDFLFENHYEDGNDTLEQSIATYVRKMPDWREDVSEDPQYPKLIEQALLKYVQTNR